MYINTCLKCICAIYPNIIDERISLTGPSIEAGSDAMALLLLLLPLLLLLKPD